MPPAFLILVEMGNLKSLLGIPLFSSLFPFICRPGSISTTFFQDFTLVCFTSSYPIELVTEISCLLFDISDFCLHHSFTTAHFLHVCFLHCRRRLVTRTSLPRIVEPLFSLYLLVLELIFGLFLCLPHIPYL